MSGSNSSAPDAAAQQPLEFTVHSLPSPQLQDSARTRTRAGRWKMLAVLAVCAAPVVVSYFTYFVVRPQGRTNYSTLITPTRGVPAALPLATLDGRAVPAGSLKGQWLLVVAGPAACEGACERRLYLQRQLREMMGRDSERIDKLWLVVDEQPVPPALRQALQSPPVLALRAPRAAVAAWLQPEPGRELEDHLYIVDPMGEWMMRAPVDPDPAKLKRDLEKLLRASAGWDQPGR
jgi:hypothetical protein